MTYFESTLCHASLLRSLPPVSYPLSMSAPSLPLKCPIPIHPYPSLLQCAILPLQSSIPSLSVTNPFPSAPHLFPLSFPSFPLPSSIPVAFNLFQCIYPFEISRQFSHPSICWKKCCNTLVPPNHIFESAVPLALHQDTTYMFNSSLEHCCLKSFFFFSEKKYAYIKRFCFNYSSGSSHPEEPAWHPQVSTPG